MSGGNVQALDMLRTDPEWSACFDRVALALEGKAAPAEDPGPVLPGGVMTPLESYARAVSAGGISLALTLPMALTVGTVAGQGAFWTRVKQLGGEWLECPMIMQTTIVAPSGYGKSTALNPLIKVVNRLDRQGHHRRGKILMERKTIAEEALKQMPLAGKALEDEQAKLSLIFKSGRCGAGLVIDSSTPEGMRNHLLASGSVAGVLTTEPDVLQEISKYSKDGTGTFRWLLDGWSAARIGVTRAGSGTVVVPRTCLPYSIIIQPVAFDQFTLPKDGRDVGIATNSAIGRGLYGRSWLARVDGFDSGQAYGMPSKATPGLVGGVAGALVAVEDVLEKLMIRSDGYRVQMGLSIGWEQTIGSGEVTEMKPIPEPEQIWLELSEDAYPVYVQVQNMRKALRVLVQQLEIAQPGADRLLSPMVARWTEHCLRIATELALTVDPAAVDIPCWAMRDASLRLVPWLLEHWAAEMTRYQAAATVALLEQEVKSNPRGEDLTFRGRVIKSLVGLRMEAVKAGQIEELSDMKWERGPVVQGALNTYGEDARPQLTNPLRQAFMDLVGDGTLSEIKTAPAGGKGRPSVRYKVGKAGSQAGL